METISSALPGCKEDTIRLAVKDVGHHEDRSYLLALCFSLTNLLGEGCPKVQRQGLLPHKRPPETEEPRQAEEGTGPGDPGRNKSVDQEVSHILEEVIQEVSQENA